ncbi:MAG: S1 RNA-binding domain-containing protein [Candidatus Paceibacterota bacterium]|jgi:small subunit ribosomal protein S1
MKTPVIVSNKENSAFGQLMKLDPAFMAFLKPGDITEAKLIKRQAGVCYFDLGKFGTGVIFGTEFLNAKNVLREVKVGDTVPAKVVDQENEEGYVELSLAGASQQKIWHELKELKEAGEPIEVTVTGANTGGLMADLKDIKAFLPVSQLLSSHYPRVENADKNKIFQELQKLVGQNLTVKIIDLNPKTAKLIISEREANETNSQEALKKYNIGDIVEGIVSGIADFGAFFKFTDDPELEGLIHISELSHKLLEGPKDVVQINDTVKAKIIEIKDGRVSLSLKALQANPWDLVKEKYQEGQELEGTIYSFNPFGAIVNLDLDIQGLIHVSEFGSIEEMKKALEPKKAYKFILASVKPEEKRITLKLKK